MVVEFALEIDDLIEVGNKEILSDIHLYIDEGETHVFRTQWVR